MFNFTDNSFILMINLLKKNCISLRLHPRNAHQCPHVVIFTAPNEIGARGIATGRHMANHNVKVHVFMADFVKVTTRVYLFVLI